MTAFDESLLLEPHEIAGVASVIADQRPAGRQPNFAVGRVIAWDTGTRRNTIQISGGLFTDLPAVDTPALTTMVAGNNVLVLMVENQWVVQGRILDPI